MAPVTALSSRKSVQCWLVNCRLQLSDRSALLGRRRILLRVLAELLLAGISDEDSLLTDAVGL